MSKKQKLTDKQKSALFVCSRVGCINADRIKDLGLNNHTVNKMVDFGYLTKETFNNKDNQEITVFRADDKGRNYINEYWDYNYHSQSIKHDYELCNQYANLSKEDRNNVITESECRHLLNDKINSIEDRQLRLELKEELEENKISCPDLMVAHYETITETIEYEVIEVITDFYTREMILSKERFCEIMQTTLTTYHT